MSSRLLLIACFLLVAGCSRTVLYSELDERQANQVEGALLMASIDADKELSCRADAGAIRVRRKLMAQIAREQDAAQSIR